MIAKFLFLVLYTCSNHCDLLLDPEINSMTINNILMNDLIHCDPF